MAEDKSKTIQLIASSVAAVAAAFVGSRLGVAGTAIGAGLGSAVTMGVSSLTESGLSRTSVKLKRRFESENSEQEDAPTVLMRPVMTTRRTRFPWRWGLAGAAVAFVVGMGILTVIELGLGRPVSGGNEGTTLTGLVGAPTSHHTAPPTTPEDVTSTSVIESSTTVSAPSVTSSAPPMSRSSETMTTSPSLTPTVEMTSPSLTTSPTTPALIPSAR